MKIPIISQAYTGRSANFETSRSVNLFPEVSTDPNNSMSVAALIGTPGSEVYKDVTPSTKSTVLVTQNYDTLTNLLIDPTPPGVTGSWKVYSATVTPTTGFDGTSGTAAIIADSSTAYVGYISQITSTSAGDMTMTVHIKKRGTPHTQVGGSYLTDGFPAFWVQDGGGNVVGVTCDDYAGTATLWTSYGSYPMAPGAVVGAWDGGPFWVFWVTWSAVAGTATVTLIPAGAAQPNVAAWIDNPAVVGSVTVWTPRLGAGNIPYFWLNSTWTRGDFEFSQWNLGVSFSQAYSGACTIAPSGDFYMSDDFGRVFASVGRGGKFGSSPNASFVQEQGVATFHVMLYDAGVLYLGPNFGVGARYINTVTGAHGLLPNADSSAGVFYGIAKHPVTGEIYFTSANRLIKYDPGLHVWTTVVASFAGYGTACGIAITLAGRIFVACSSALDYGNTGAGLVEIVAGAIVQRDSRSLVALAADKDDNLFAWDNGGVICRYPAGVYTAVNVQPLGGAGVVYDIAVDPNYRVYAAATGGYAYSFVYQSSSIVAITTSTAVTTYGTGSIRGLHTIGNTMYVVFGDSLYAVTGDNPPSVSRALGKLTTRAGRVKMSDNGTSVAGVGGDQLMIVDGANGYLYNFVSDTFTQLSAISPKQATATVVSSQVSSFIKSVAVPTTPNSPVFKSISGTVVSATTGSGAVVTPNLGYGLRSWWYGAPEGSGGGYAVYFKDIPNLSTEVTPGGGRGFYFDGASADITFEVIDPTGTGGVVEGLFYTDSSSGVSLGYISGYYVRDAVWPERVAYPEPGMDIGAGGLGYTNPYVKLTYTTPNGDIAVVDKLPVTLATEWATVQSFTVAAGGSNYSNDALVTVTGTTRAGNTANLTSPAAVTSGTSFLSAISITNAGQGYTATPSASMSGFLPDGTSVTTPLDVVMSQGKVQLLTFSDQTVASESFKGTPTILIDAPTGVDFPTAPNSLTFVDGYFIVAGASMAFHVSNLYDGLYWNPLAAAAVVATSDNVQALVNSRQQLWVIKKLSSEVWYNTGVSTAQGGAFARVQGAVVDVGTASPHSVVSCEGSLYFLATQKIDSGGAVFIGLVTLSGYSPTVVSPPAITFKMSKWKGLVDAFAYSFSEGGHTFVVITSPDDDQTFVFDATTGFWHEWSSFSENPGHVGRHFSNCYARYFGRHLVGDYASGNLCSLSYDLGTENGNPIISQRVVTTVGDSADGQRLFISRLSVDAELGSDSSDSVVSLAWSNDSGHTWSNEHGIIAASPGEYGKRMSWRRLGYARNKVFRLTSSSIGKKVFANSTAEIGP